MHTAEFIAAQPGVQKVPSPKLALFIRKRLMDGPECAEIIGLIDEERRPSTIADDMGDPTFRTSETCDLDGSIPAVAALEEKIIAFTGLDPIYGEPIQG